MLITKIKRFACACVLVLIASGVCFAVLSALHPALSAAYRALGPHRPTYQGRNMGEWLKMLALQTNFSDSPLRIARIACDSTSELATAQVPLSYDLLNKYGFLNIGHAKLCVVLNGNHGFSGCSPGTNGDCLIPFDTSRLKPGTNQLQIAFIIFSRTNTDFLQAVGPATEFIWTNAIHGKP